LILRPEDERLRWNNVRHGDYEMNDHVVECEPDRRIGGEPAPDRTRAGMTGGRPVPHQATFALSRRSPNR
jgi:hypothetical protein